MLNKLLAQYIAEKDGATAIEYGLLAAGISIVLVTVAFLFGDQLEATFTDITTAMAGAG
ncbi:MAG: Flp family type IVb pilin [Pseudomonadota bacterium]